jgi:hypothetical protein
VPNIPPSAPGGYCVLRSAATGPSTICPRHLRSPIVRTVGKIAIVAAVAAGLVACSSAGQDGATPAPTAAAPASAGSVANLPACTADDITVAGDPGSKPTITVPDTCSPPKQLLSKDLVVGTGPEVTEGVTMQTHYDLVTWSDKQELDSSWSRGEPFPLENVGRASVIDGWNEGLIGMKEGGRRLLIVPPDKGYGQGGNGIRPGETLVFVVDAVKVTG